MRLKLIQTLGVCALLCFGILAHAQSRTVKGTVLDQNDQAVIGAMVQEKGTTNGTYTGADGTFTLTITTTNPVLMVTAIGKEDQEVALGESNEVTIKMAASAEEIGEIVVTAQNFRVQSRSLGYAVASVSSDDVTEGGDRSVLNAMQGKIAGVSIDVASTDPGASTRVVIRGPQSLTQGNQPLIVVDGVPLTNSSVGSSQLSGAFDFGNGLNAINPEDIESVQVLKGSSATALYGSRAANGVIMITTKTGQGASALGGGGLGIEYSGNVTMFNVLRMPEFQNEFGQGWDGNHWLDENGSWGPAFDGRERVFGRVVNNSQLLAEYTALESNVRDFFEQGVSYKNHVAITAGNMNQSFYASFSNVNHDGIYPGSIDVYDRNTIALRASQRIGDINVSGTMNVASTRTGFVPTGQGQEGIYNNLMQLPRNMSVVDMMDYNAPFYNIDEYFTQYGVTNPYFVLNENKNNYTGTKFYGGITTDYSVTDNTKLIYRFGYDIEEHNTHVHRAILLPDGVNAGSVDDPGFVSEQMNGSQQFNHDLMLAYKRDLNSFMTFDFTGGVNANSRETQSLFTSVTGLDIGGFYNISNSPSTPVVARTSTLRKIVGVYGLATFGYKNYLFVNASARNDWSSTLPEENNSFFYPAVNLSYIFTDAIDGLPSWMDYGKFRAGYGWSGNDAPPYVINSVYTQTSHYMPWRNFNYPLGTGVNSFSVGNRIKNPNLQPEITKEAEVGVDMKLFDNRVGIDFTYYNRVTDGQILIVPVSPSSGYTNYYANPAVVSNKGIEALVSYKILRNDDGLNWTISANYTRNRNNVEQLDESIEEFNIGGLSTVSFIAIPGMPMGVFKGEVVKTVMIDGVEHTVVDNNGVPVAATEKEIYGDAQQLYVMGISNYLSWKNFNLGFTFDIRKGGLMFSRTADINFFTGNSVKTLYNDRKPFVVPNSVVETTDTDEDGNPIYVENTTAVDPAHMDDYHRASAFDRQNVIDKSFVKLREVSLSYTVPQNIVDKTPFSGMTVSLIGRNLLLWTPVDNQFIDPEVTSFGNGLEAGFGEFSANPTTRSYGFAFTFNL